MTRPLSNVHHNVHGDVRSNVRGYPDPYPDVVDASAGFLDREISAGAARRPPVENAKMRPDYSPNYAVLVALLHELLNVEQFDTIADVCDALKTRAARLRIPYDVRTIAAALEAVYHTRALTTRRT